MSEFPSLWSFGGGHAIETSAGALSRAHTEAARAMLSSLTGPGGLTVTDDRDVSYALRPGKRSS
jgi:hypothetical protein